MEELDCVVIGAGWYGLAAAKQYHCMHPTASLAVLDSQAALGGTWAEERLYPSLRSNNLWGTFEYPDFPMDEATFGVGSDEYIPGHVVNRYLHAYAAEFGIAGLIRPGTKVLVAEHRDTEAGGWTLTTSSAGGQARLFARKLVVATGLTSEAWLPRFCGQESFGGRVFHGKHFRQNRDTLNSASRVTVFGGTKSSWDAVYAYVTAGVEVDWVIRPTGHGPCWVAPSYVTPFKQWIEKLANMRFLTWLSPCVWGEVDGYGRIRRLLHETRIGRAIVDGYWGILGRDALALMGYDAHPETAKLKPWTEAMFTGASFSIRNYDTDPLDYVRSGQVRVHTSDIAHLSAGKVHLADGTELASEVLLANTGWKHVPPIQFLPKGIEKELGIPHAWDDDNDDDDDGDDDDNENAYNDDGDLANQKRLMRQADEEILRRFPRLRRQPVWNRDYVPLAEQKGIIRGRDDDEMTPSTALTPFMLHRFVAPASGRLLRARDVAFSGIVSNFSNMICAHVQGLWIAAYFAGTLARDPGATAAAAAAEAEAEAEAAAVGGKKENNAGDSATAELRALRALRYETVLHNRFGRWRYTDWGARAPTFIFDAVPYLDLLLRDLGLEIHRKGGWWAEMTDPYGPEDYRTVNDEWLASRAEGSVIGGSG